MLTKNVINSCYQAVIEGLFPRFCVRCGQEQTLFCTTCQEVYLPGPKIFKCVFCGQDGLGQTCQDCRQETYLDGAISLSSYGDPVLRNTIRQWKYHGDQELTDLISKWVLACLYSTQLPQLSWSTTFVPLHRARQRERGFNQAELFSKMVSRSIGTQQENLLERRYWTEPQARRHLSERSLGELDDIFVTTGPIPEFVLICDDVITSGATIDAAAKALKQSGARVVWAVSLGRGRTQV